MPVKVSELRILMEKMSEQTGSGIAGG